LFLVRDSAPVPPGVQLVTGCAQTSHMSTISHGCLIAPSVHQSSRIDL
jgi:hypothetical protein